MLLVLEKSVERLVVSVVVVDVQGTVVVEDDFVASVTVDVTRSDGRSALFDFTNGTLRYGAICDDTRIVRRHNLGDTITVNISNNKPTSEVTVDRPFCFGGYTIVYLHGSRGPGHDFQRRIAIDITNTKERFSDDVDAQVALDFRSPKFLESVGSDHDQEVFVRKKSLGTPTPGTHHR